MCFAPQRRALFWHVNFQKWSENGVFCTFWLQNVLRATTACNFKKSQLPKVFRTREIFTLLTSTSGPTNFKSLEKHKVFRDFPTFSRTWIFFLLIVSSLIFFLLLFSSLALPISAFHLSMLSEVWLLNLLPLIYIYIYIYIYIWYPLSKLLPNSNHVHQSANHVNTNKSN